MQAHHINSRYTHSCAYPHVHIQVHTASPVMPFHSVQPLTRSETQAISCPQAELHLGCPFSLMTVTNSPVTFTMSPDAKKGLDQNLNSFWRVCLCVWGRIWEAPVCPIPGRQRELRLVETTHTWHGIAQTHGYRVHTHTHTPALPTPVLCFSQVHGPG